MTHNTKRTDIPDDLSVLLNTLLENVNNSLDLIQTVPQGTDLSDAVRLWLIEILDELRQHASQVQVVESVKELIEIQCTDKSKWSRVKYCAIEQVMKSDKDCYINTCASLIAHYFTDQAGDEQGETLLSVSNHTACYVGKDEQLAMLTSIIKSQ